MKVQVYILKFFKQYLQILRKILRTQISGILEFL